ncbi:MAG: cadherin-like domain-containing protein, partial [Gemmataceae bacterium]|nr:cadherin-like domain-containing protein [Gemmataceae bacterium]
FTTPAGRPLTVPAAGVLGNDVNNDVLGPLSVVGLTPPPAAEGTLVLNADGSFTFTPAAGFVGTTAFSYTVTDGVTTAGPVTVTITVTNLPPVAVPDSFTVGQNRPLAVPAPGVLANDDDPDDTGPLTAALVGGVSPAGAGTVALNADGSFVFTPTAGFVGTATFGYAASDGIASSRPVTVAITVTPAIPPTANPDAYTIGQNRPLTIPGPGVLGNDAANDIFGPLVAVVVTPPPAADGTLALNPDGSFTFTPAAGFVGATTFTYSASDGVTSSPPAGVTITVTPAIPPVANPDAFTLGGARVLTVPAPGVLANDAADDIFGPLVAVLDTAPPPAAGTLVLNPDGSFTFTAARTFSGTTTFTYRATDGVTTSGPVAVTIAGTAATRLYAVGAGAGPGSVARVRAFAGDGSPRFDFVAFEPPFDGGVRVAVGDVTGDRVDDIVAAAGPGGGPRVAVFDGATGALARSFFAYEPTFGLGVHVSVADLDRDGFADIVTGTGSGGGPRVQAFSGRTGEVLANFFPYDPRFRGGVRVGAGDLDRDGRAEVVTAAGPSGGPDIGVFDAAGNQLARFFGFDPAYRGGAFVSVGRTGDGSARLYLAPDSFPDFRGSVLGDQFPELADTAGVPPGVPAEAGRLVGPPRVYV